MSALERLQEFRFKKSQSASQTGGSTSATNGASSSSTSSSRSASKEVEPNILVLVTSDIEPDSDSDSDLRRGVNKMSTHSPLRGSPKPTATTTNNNKEHSNGSNGRHISPSSSNSSLPKPPLQPDFSTTNKSNLSTTQLPFKKLVGAFRYTGEGATDLTQDSDQSLSSIASGLSDSEVNVEDDDDVVMMDTPQSSHKPSIPNKRQIISSDEDEEPTPKPRRRLVRKGDLEKVVAEAPKRRRLVKKAALLDSDEESASGSRSGTATVQISDDDEDEDQESKDMKLAQLQNMFPDSNFSDLTKALEAARGDFASAASRLIQPSSDLFSLETSAPSAPAPAKALTYSFQPEKNRPQQLKQRTPVAPPSPLKKKKQVYRDASSDDSGDSFDDEEGPNKYTAQDRKEERALHFFNSSTLLELRELTGCSKAQAVGVMALRPFSNFDGLCVSLRKTKGVGEKIVNNYLTTTDAIRAVDMMLKTVDQVREDLVGTLSIWCGDDNSKIFDTANSSNSMKIIEEVEKKAENEDEDDEEPGMELLDIDADKLEQTEAGRKAMRGFIRKQPSNMAPGFQLKGYQLLGINWLALLWRKGLSGILADEMGLGKTAQVIAFLAHLHETGEDGPFLIIVPSSTLSNWLREFEKFCPELDVRSYYGTQAEREEMRHELDEDPSYNVIVTTYAIATGNNDERKFLNRRNFKGIVLDEGHMVKNCTSARYKQLMSIKTPFRLLLTGTPLQNNLEELLSLLIFIMPKLFSEHEEVLRTMFKVKVDATSEKSTLLSHERIVRARHMIAPFVLRRKKIHVLKDLPRKVEEVIYCDLHPDQRVLYDRIMSSQALQAVLGESAEDENAGTSAGLDVIELDGMSAKAKAKAIKAGAKKPTAASKKAANEQFANVLMQMRKAADHPMLFRELYTDEKIKKMAKVITKEVEFCTSNIDYIEEDMSVMTDFELHRLCKQYKSVNRFALPGDQWMAAGKVDVLKKLLPRLIQKDKSRILIFSQFTMVLDILESILKTMTIKYLRMDGQTKVEERQPLIDSFNDDDSFSVFLLSTKAGGFGINLTGANVVIMYDLDFNPHNDKQAEDRAHRVGQTREVQVIKLISKDTIEEQIYQLANLKLKLDQHVSQDDSSLKAAEAAASNSSAASSSSTPSAGILSLIKQNWKATHSAAKNRKASNTVTTKVVRKNEEEEEREQVVKGEKEGKKEERRLSLSSSSSLSSADSI